jgi:hypothetical protein
VTQPLTGVPRAFAVWSRTAAFAAASQVAPLKVLFSEGAMLQITETLVPALIS